MSNNKNFYDGLNELVTDVRFRNLALTQNFEHLFNRNGINETETMSFFGWMLNPRGSHGFRDTFFREMITTTWSMIHGQQGEQYKTLRSGHFYAHLSPIAIERRSFENIYVDVEASRECTGADIVITDVDSRTMVVINNRYDEKICQAAYKHYSADQYKHFENRIFISYDSAILGSKDTQWCYTGNGWMIDLCARLLETTSIAQGRSATYLQDFYQFLTGAPYGVSEKSMAEDVATLVADYYTTLTDYRNLRAEKISGVSLVDITPREYATKYEGQLSETEYSAISLYWSHRNTFNTFFQVAELESVTRNLEKSVEGKAYRFDRTFIRGGLCFTPAFSKVRTERAFMNDVFDVELVQDGNKNLSLSMVVNKDSWDRLTQVQRTTLQKKFGFESVLFSERVVVWNRFYGNTWQNKDLCSDISEVFVKIDDYLANIGIKAA